MPKTLQVENHLSLTELATRYRQATDPVERTHYQVIWLLARGYKAVEVADVVGYHRNWVYQLLRRYNQRRCRDEGGWGTPEVTIPESSYLHGMSPLPLHRNLKEWFPGLQTELPLPRLWAAIHRIPSDPPRLQR